MVVIADSRRSFVWLFAGLVLLAAPAQAEEGSVWVGAVAEADTSQSQTQSRSAEGDKIEDGTPGRRRSMKAFSEVLENIVVTTRKRQEAIQDTPVAITAFGEDSLRQLNVRRIQDLSPSVPNLEYGRTVGFTSARANSRGVGQTDPIGTIDPGVGLYVDGVYFARAQAGLASVIDAERIEVVRGPQGTIFGKNTIGGAVNVITRAPGWDVGGDAEVRVGNFDAFETRASFNVPLVAEKLAARFSVATASRDGFEKERLGGTDPNDEKLLAGRAQLRWLPSEDFELLLSADTSRENQVLSQGKCSVLNPGQGQLAFLNALVGYTQACADVSASDNPRRVETDVSFLRDELKTYGGSLRMIWEIGPDTTLRSTTALRGLENENFNDFDGTRIELIRPAIDDVSFDQRQLSQEVQLSSRAMDGKLDYLLGLYAFKEESDDQLLEGVLSRVQGDDIVFVPQPLLDGAAMQATGAPFALLPPEVQAGIRAGVSQGLADGIRGAQIKFVNRVDNLSYSAFGQASYAITDQLNFTAGLRITSERRRLFRRGVAQTPGQPLAVGAPPLMPGDFATFYELSDRFTDFTPSASLSYKFREGLLAYASYSTGFKSGGFNGRAFPQVGDDQFPVSFDPEDLTTYELGFKGSFLDQRVGLNVAAFYSIYEDVQLTVLNGDPAVNNVAVQLLNAGESIITGGELELVVNPIPNLQLRSSLGVLHDRFTDFDDPGDPRAKDRHLQFASAYTTSTSVEYGFDLLSLGSLTARADWSTRSRQFLDVANTDRLRSGKRGLLDARVALQLSDGMTEVAIFGRNLLDREYLASGVDFSNTFGQVIRFVGPPRTYGLELRRRF